MSRIKAAGIAERVRSQCLIEITQILIIQKRAPPVILTEALLFPVDRIMQTFSKLPLHAFILLKRILIDHDLPSRAAGIRAISGCTDKFIVKMWF